ncbi:orotidine-5'-phosphate decarboxylase [Natribacillus halophilus]|uniref:Orotidine 5'-phosphate decarboxylase n=1 Tax=Natribacillus halophilus TaxID=549003 RepID=A0A1G8MH70_9BACI|nr:orotidine-5'-phosphate decarboxylase [Natribacillus halophilus]SDI67167.1 orotidine-5'-phosphate decarboxylase [Natribacillus halophilus]
MRPLFIALDMATKKEALTFLDGFHDERPAVKVGMELFYASGPVIVEELKARGHTVFLDLKCHDIPKTVERTMQTLANLGVDLVTLHASGGKAMMEAAKEGLETGAPPGTTAPRCVAVTALTSLSEKQMQTELLIERRLEDTVLHFTDMAVRSGLDGVVCSVNEVQRIRGAFGEGVYTVTPGIQLAETNSDDQKRAATPVEARQAGSNAIVVGRAITTSPEPLKTYDTIFKEWTGYSYG